MLEPDSCGLAGPVLFVVIVAARRGYGCFKMSALTTTAEPGPLFSTQCTVSLVSYFAESVAYTRTAALVLVGADPVLVDVAIDAWNRRLGIDL